jgi:hypothetical protein
MSKYEFIHCTMTFGSRPSLLDRDLFDRVGLRVPANELSTVDSRVMLSGGALQMGKVKKTKKFAAVKRMISPKDSRL